MDGTGATISSEISDGVPKLTGSIEGALRAKSPASCPNTTSGRPSVRGCRLSIGKTCASGFGPSCSCGMPNTPAMRGEAGATRFFGNSGSGGCVETARPPPPSNVQLIPAPLISADSLTTSGTSPSAGCAETLMPQPLIAALLIKEPGLAGRGTGSGAMPPAWREALIPSALTSGKATTRSSGRQWKMAKSGIRHWCCCR